MRLDSQRRHSDSPRGTKIYGIISQNGATSTSIQVARGDTRIYYRQSQELNKSDT